MENQVTKTKTKARALARARAIQHGRQVVLWTHRIADALEQVLNCQVEPEASDGTITIFPEGTNEAITIKVEPGKLVPVHKMTDRQLRKATV
jgi:hypothetical protein